MSKQLTRRSVLAATIVVILGLTAGFVVANQLGGLVAHSSGQNAGTITGPTDTIFAAGPSTLNITLVQRTASDCGQPVQQWSHNAANLSVFYSGTGTCTNGTLNWFEDLNWTDVPCPGAGQLDSFYITVTYLNVATPEYEVAEFSLADVTANDPAFPGALNVFLDAGPTAAGALPNAYTSISIAVSGT